MCIEVETVTPPRWLVRSRRIRDGLIGMVFGVFATAVGLALVAMALSFIDWARSAAANVVLSELDVSYYANSSSDPAGNLSAQCQDTSSKMQILIGGYCQVSSGGGRLESARIIKQPSGPVVFNCNWKDITNPRNGKFSATAYAACLRVR